MLSAADQLRIACRASIELTELQHAAVQLRLMTAVLMGSMLCELLDPALLLVTAPGSLVHRAAAATTLGPLGMAGLLAACAALLLPLLVLQLWPCASRARRRDATRLACLALAASAVLWTFLAWRALTALDLQGAPLLFARHGFGALLVAGALAWSLNAEQLRVLLERSSC